MSSTSGRRYPLLLLLILLAVLAWSVIAPHDYFTWVMEVFAVLIGVPVLLLSWRRFPLNNLLYTLILLHAIILLVGGHYTYARVPLFDWIKETFHLSRNHFDRVGHFAQGFVPAMLARELLIRTSPLKPGRWLFALVICVALAISAAYELLEWGTAIMTGEKAEDFLATQGDVWDTQKDMGLALIGAILAQLLLSRWHDRQLRKLNRGCERAAA